MYEQLEIHYEGQTEFVATDQQRKPVRLFVTCPAGLEAGPTCAFRSARFIPFLASGRLKILLSKGARAWW